MAVYDLYGYLGNANIDVTKETIDTSLGIHLRKHESLYHAGEYYRCGNIGREHFILQHNYNQIDKEWMEDEYKDYLVLFYVNETSRFSELETLLLETGKFKLLRRDDLQPGRVGEIPSDEH